MVRAWANYFRHGVSRVVFEKIDHFTWWRLVHWIRRKHSRINVKEVLRRFADRWRLTCNGATYRGATSVAIQRYRYREKTSPHRGPRNRQPLTQTRREPGAVKAARRVRRAGRGNPPGEIPAGRPGPTQL